MDVPGRERLSYESGGSHSVQDGLRAVFVKQGDPCPSSVSSSDYLVALGLADPNYLPNVEFTGSGTYVLCLSQISSSASPSSYVRHEHVQVTVGDRTPSMPPPPPSPPPPSPPPPDPSPPPPSPPPPSPSPPPPSPSPPPP
eukprot:2002827-Prymnesium_polylepis.1